MKITVSGSAITTPDGLDRSGSDRLAPREDVPDDVLEAVTMESETVRIVVECPEGLSRRTTDDSRTVDVPLLLALTDRRVLFCSRAALEGDGDADAGGIDYGDLAGIELGEGSIDLSTTDDVEWTVPALDGPGEVLDAFRRDLAWIGECRRRVVATADDVEAAADEVREHAEAEDWEAAEETYGQTRDRLDAVVGAVQRTEPVVVDALAPELTRLERTLEGAYTDFLIERADSRLTLASQLVETGDHDRMAAVVDEARDDYRRAQAHAEALERGDEFRFGQQRSAREKLERLAWEIDAVAAEPLREAYEAKLLAEAAEDPDEQVENWERTYRRFRAVFDLLERDDDGFAGDVNEVREEVRSAARRLLAIHRTLARSILDEAEGEEGDREPDRLDEAIEHVERAHELAEEYHPDATPDLERRLDRLRAERDRPSEADSETDSISATAEGSESADDGEEATEDFYRGGASSRPDYPRELVVGADADGSD